MAECEKLSGCPFFNDTLEKMPAIANMMKSKYCQGMKDSCARYMVAAKLGKEKVPGNLYPNMKDEALAILARG